MKRWAPAPKVAGLIWPSVIKADNLADVTASELKRWLKRQGCTFKEGTKHTKVMLGSKVSRMPRHPSKEIKNGTYNSILEDLGLKPDRS